MNTVKEFVEILKEASKEKTRGYDTTATVTRVEGDTIYAHIAGGVKETPIRRTIDAKAGDTIQIHVEGGKAWTQGNETAPPTDDTTAKHAQRTATVAREAATSAKDTAEEAMEAVGSSIVTDTLHYLATSQGSGVTTDTQGWTTTVQRMTETNRYLWTYHTYAKAGGNSTNTTPVITGVYGEHGSQGAKGDKGDKGDTGEAGDDGVSVTAVQPQYYLSTSTSSATGGTWGSTLVYESGKYIWTRDQVTYSSGNPTYSTEVYNEALTHACSVSEDALNLAEGIDEHFWYDNTGAHVTEDTQEDYQDDPSNAGGNVLITSGGLAVREGTKELGSFTGTGVQLGETNGAHSIIDANGQRFYGSNGTTQLANIGYGQTQGESGQVTAPYYTFGRRKSGSVNGDKSVAEGYNTEASGPESHAEGCNTEATGTFGAHAEGYSTEASGESAHSEGFSTKAIGVCSHASGSGTIASKNYQSAIGQYNVEDTETISAKQKAFIIGNGNIVTRSNAFSVDWSGNVEADGDIEDGSGNVLADKADSSAFFKIVNLDVTNSAQIAAHGYQAAATYTVPAAIRPSGMTLVGIVGYGTSNYRLQSTTHFVNGRDSILANMANTSATAVSAGAKITFKLLYIKATSA